MSDALDAIIGAMHLPASYGTIAQETWRPLAAQLAIAHARKNGLLIAGIQGAQGSGKSTAVRFLAYWLEEEHGLRTAVLSLDDLYLTRAEREEKARAMHPLFATRGVPGTHDAALGLELFDALAQGAPVGLPRFDKAADDRSPSKEWQRINAPIDVLLFEGWCVGLPPEDPTALITPVNALESLEDADGRWRRAVNAALASDYATLFARVDFTIVLQVDTMASIAAWRTLQESQLAKPLLSGATMTRFLQHYERLTRHALEVMPGLADALFHISSDHGVRAG